MTILFYPDPINEVCRLHSTLKELSIDFHNDPTKPYDHFFYWSYHKTVREPDGLINSHPSVINKGCCDISKSRVGLMFDNRLSLDPRIHNGTCVKKSEGQGFHDGQIISCPAEKEGGFIYQRYIDTKDKSGLFVDYRIFYSGKIDFVVSKRRSNMFIGGAGSSSLEIMKATDILSGSQIDDIISGCNKFGLDFGEIDVIIDQHKNAYVIDVNNIAGNGMLSSPIANIVAEEYRKSFVEFLKRRKQ